ncbi:MAG: hypothetical protein FD147_195 [Chloroflexi bacterium]|nr:MAG: hypothetical protein FD147_195 [Chloroflexota bacterium]
MLPTTNPNSKNAVSLAEKWLSQKPVYVDTETTGLEKNDEIIEISIIDYDGNELLTSLVKPSQQIPLEAVKIHGISNEMVAASPVWPIVWSRARNFFYGRIIAAYNAPFDLRMMQQSHARYRLSWHENLTFVDILPLYSDFRGVWDPIRRSMRYFKLEEAGAFFNITLPNAHRSTADALLTRAILHSIAGKPY